VTVGQMYLALPIAGVIIALFALEDLVRSGRGEVMLAGDDAQTEAALDAAGAGSPESPSSPSGQKGAGAVDPATLAGVILVAGVVVLIVVGAPIAIVIGLPSIVALAAVVGTEQAVFVASQRMFTGASSFTLLAIPFFVLAGSLMNTGG